MGQILDRSDDDWIAVRWNARKARQVWIRLEKLLRREGADQRASEMFYWAVVQAVLILGAETWVLLAAVSRKLEGVHVGFLRQRDGIWISEAAEKVLKEAGTQTLGSYIEKRQATVAEWVVLRPIPDICDRETGYEGWRRRYEPWWRHTADRKQLGATLKEILSEARARRWDFGRHDEGGGGREVS